MAFFVKKTSFLLALITAFAGILPGAALATSYSISNMNITSGSFTVKDATGALIINPSSGSTVTVFDHIGANTNLVGGYIGSGGASTSSTSPNSTYIMYGTWFGAPASAYTAASNLGDVGTPAGTIVGGSIPTGTVDTTSGTISMNLSSLFSNWSEVDFNAGTGKADGVTSPLATGTWDPITHVYSLSWTSAILLSGPCRPGYCTAQFTLSGTANAATVPLPPSAFLLLSGLLGLGGFLKKRHHYRPGTHYP